MEDSLSNKVLNSFKQLFTGQAIQTLAGFIAAFFYARLLGPETYGTWQTAKVFTQYTMLFAFGLPFVMRRDFIQLRSEGLIKEANNMANLVFTYFLMSGPVFSIVLFIIAFFFTKDKNFSYALTTVGILNLINVFVSYGDIVNKGFNNYSILKNAKIILSIFTLITIIFVWKFGFNGLLIGLIISNIATALYYITKSPIPLKIYWSFELLKKMIFIGFPIYLQSIAVVIFSSIDRVIIAALLSFKEVGYYSLSALIKIPITMLVSSLGIVIFTQLNEKYGKDKSTKVVKLHMEIPQLFVTYVLSPFIIIGIIILPFLVNWFLPQYTPGILTAQVFVFAVLFLTLAGFSSNALFILDKQKIAALAFTIAGVIKTIGSLVLLKLEFGIVGVAIATLIAYFIYDTIMIYSVKKQINEKFNLKFIFDKNMPILYSIFSYLGIKLIINFFYIETEILNMIIQLILFLILLIPYFFIAKHKLSFILNRIRN